MSLKSNLSLNIQRYILPLSKGSYYYKPKGESEFNLMLMKEIDKIHTENPGRGVMGTVLDLTALGFLIGPKRVRRLMRKMQINAVMPRRNLSKKGDAKHTKPYLLRNLKVTKPLQVWSIDITYIPMERGFMHLTAIIDVITTTDGTIRESVDRCHGRDLPKPLDL